MAKTLNLATSMGHETYLQPFRTELLKEYSNMNLVGIDIAKRSFVAAAIDSSSQVILSPQTFGQDRDGFQALARTLEEKAGGRDAARIGLEASGHYGRSLWNWLVADGWRVEVFNPLVVQNRNVRGRKTDADDALAIARTLRDRNYSVMHRGDSDHRAVKAFSRQRRWLTERLSDAKKRLRSTIDQLFPEIDGLFSDLFGAAPLAMLAEAPSADAVAKMNIVRMTNLLAAASRNRISRERAEKIRHAARLSIAAGHSEPGLEWTVQQMIREVQHLDAEIALVERQIKQAMECLDTPIRSIPGVGPVTAAVIVSELGDLARFDYDPKRVLAYAGMDPRVRESGQWRGKTKMTKRGSRYLRTALFQAANMVRLNQPTFSAIYDKHRKDKGKHHRVAVSHAARHLVQVICAMSRRNTPFDVDKLCFQTP